MDDHSINLAEMGKRIKDLRQKQNKTQKFFADLLFISPSYLTLIEKGERTMTLDVLVQIAKICDVSTDYLLFGNITEINDSNFKTLHRLCENHSPEQIKQALRLAEYYLHMNDFSENN